MSKILSFGLAVFCLLFFGCAQKVVVSEVLQMQIDDSLYTKYNVWYEDSQKISSLNIQKGNILPIGTKVEIVECDSKGVTFIDVNDNKSYHIIFNADENLTTMDGFVRQLFTTKDVDTLLKDVPKGHADLIKMGKITEGMSKDEIVLTYGEVSPVHTPDKRNITWMYPIDKDKYIRLIFRGDKLRTILNLYDN